MAELEANIFMMQKAWRRSFLSGDLKYHEAQEAYASDIIVVDGGHFYTEHPVVQNLANRLRQSFEEKNWDIEVVEDPVARDVFSYIG